MAGYVGVKSTMLDTLRRIVQDVSTAKDLNEALNVIVEGVQEALKVDVCSVYQALPDHSELLLRATVGLNPDCVDHTRLSYSEGLVGLVAERAEPVNIDDASQHPRYKYIPETGEEVYHAFLGVPVIHQRKLQGVLVVQDRINERFTEEDLTLLVTLAAQVAGAISHANATNGMLSTLRNQAIPVDLSLPGISGSPGVAVGTVAVIFQQARLDSVPDRIPTLPEAEIELFESAVRQVKLELEEIKDRLGDRLPSEERLLFDAYILILSSDTIVEGTIGRIKEGNWAPGALRDTIKENVRIFEEMDDAYLRERAVDLRDIGERILLRLQEVQETRTGFPQRTILVGEEVTATQLVEVPPEALAGVVSAKGTGSSHVAILARAMGIPTVMGVSDLPVERMEGREVIVDGYQGKIYLQPSDAIRSEYMRLFEEEQELSQDLKEMADLPAITPDGVTMPVYVNGGLMADLATSLVSGADGVGLYRTEIPFMIRDRFPGEHEQQVMYRQILSAFAPRPVTLRTLDVGGDKALPYFQFEEDNPFLGWRGIRITLDHPEIFLTQLRAMMLASEGLDNLHILLPMVGSVAEVDETFLLIDQVYEELTDDGFRLSYPRVGVMIEVPSAVYLVPQLARRVDYLSVGTNDLIQYLLAVDRNNARVADLYDMLHPAVLRAMNIIQMGAKQEGKPVSVCGEMAADPEAVILLLGMDYDSLSVSVAAIPRIKWVIRSIEQARARDLYLQVMEMEDSGEIRALLQKTLLDAGLGGLVRPGKS
jgi:phosphotransferase system enzyme I (PtsP)